MRKNKMDRLQRLQETEEAVSDPEDQDVEQQSCCDKLLDHIQDKYDAYRQHTIFRLLLWTVCITVIAFLLFSLANSAVGRPWLNKHLGIDMDRVKSTVLEAVTTRGREDLEGKVEELVRRGKEMEITIQTLSEKLQNSLTKEEELEEQVQILEEQLKNPGDAYQRKETPPKTEQPTKTGETEKRTETVSSEKTVQTIPDKETEYPESTQPPKEPQEFIIPRNFWIYPAPTQNLNYLQQLLVENNKHFAQLSNYSLHLITKQNHQDFLTPASATRLHNLLNTLRNRLADPADSSNLKFHIDDIERMLTTFSILHEQGGIITTDKFIITETFDWLRDIQQNIYINKGTPHTIPQVVGFYSPYYSSPLEKQNKKPYPGMEKVEKYMVVLPALEHYFIAAQNNTQFVGKLLDQMFNALSNPASMQEEVNQHPQDYPGLSGKDSYFEYYKFSAVKVLRSKQADLDKIHEKDAYRTFAVDYFGLLTMSCYYAPYKIKIFWGNNQSLKIFQNLARYDLKEYYANVGPLRYLDFSTIPRELNEFLTKIKEDTTGTVRGIMKGSYLQTMLFPYANETFIYDNPEKPFVNSTAEPWEGLPKIIWVYWDKGLKNARASTQLCVENLRRLGGASNFTVNEVNDTNLRNYIDKQTLAKIQNALTNHKVLTYPQSKGDFYRLAIVAKHGGIYMDSSFFALQNLDWLVNIGRYPSEYIFNRYGHLPKVVMYWHPHYGSPFDWQVDRTLNTKAHWHFPYENNFIAAEKDSEFVKEWLELYIEFMLTPYTDIQKVFETCDMANHKWTEPDSQYLLAMDTAKCIVGRRQKLIKKDELSPWKGACDYYKLWSMSGYLGQQKFRSSTNYDRPQSDDHTLLYRYSQDYAQGLLGKVRHLTKLYGVPNKQLNKFITRHIDGDFSEQAHPKSVFMKFLFDKPYKLDIVDQEAILRQ